MTNSKNSNKLPKAVDFIIYIVANIVVGSQRHLPYVFKYSWIGIIVFLALSYYSKEKTGVSIDIHQGTNTYSF